jgi:hypothetical protein
MALFPSAFPALSPLVAEELQASAAAAESPEAAQDRAEQVHHNKARRAAGARPWCRRRARASACARCARKRERTSKVGTRWCADGAVRADAARCGAQLMAVREARKDVVPIGKAQTEAELAAATAAGATAPVFFVFCAGAAACALNRLRAASPRRAAAGHVARSAALTRALRGQPLPQRSRSRTHLPRRQLSRTRRRAAPCAFTACLLHLRC